MVTQNAAVPFDYSGYSGVTRSGAEKFPNPFFDIASEYVPSDLNQIFELCEYLFMTMAPFHAVTSRVSRYFLTEISVEGAEDDDREKYEDFFSDQLKLIDILGEVGDNYFCLHGDTLVTTEDGEVPIRELEGRTVRVLSQGGVYREAHFRCYGAQSLMRVTFSDGTSVLATPEHQWIVRGRARRVRTAELTLSDSVPVFGRKGTDRVYVTALSRTTEFAKVYCCVEPRTHSFCIENGILTGNCYGNVYLSLYLPFDRMLGCPHCKTEYHCEAIQYKFKKGEFLGRCPKCGEDVTFTHVDRRSPDIKRVRLITWNPKFIKLRVHPISGRTEYYLEMDRQLCQKLKDGNPFYLNDTPWSMIECALRPNDNLFRFREGSIFHLRAGSLAGLPIRGWGIPPMLPNFKLAYYIQLLRRYDEAITLDYIVPFRVLFPQAQSSDGKDALSMMNMGAFVAQMRHMVENHRKQITDVQVAPFAIGYQMLGGEAKTLSPKDNIQMALDELFTAMGYPSELYKGSLSLQAAPVALRLFEKEWAHLVSGYNDIIEWITTLVGRYFRWSNRVEATLRPVTLADDLERKAIILQSAAGQDISKQTAYQTMGIDYMEEQKRVVEEQQEIQKLQQKAMEEASTQQLDGSGGENAGPGAVVGATPGDVSEQAKEIAQQLLTQTPATMRRAELIKIKHSNPTLHALVLQNMDEMRSQAAAQGRAMLESGQM